MGYTKSNNNNLVVGREGDYSCLSACVERPCAGQ